MNCHTDLSRHTRRLAVIECETGLLHKRVCISKSVIYHAECVLSCDQTSVCNYSRIELRTVLSFPSFWQVENVVCYRWNCSLKYRCYNIILSRFKKFQKKVWKKYIYVIHTHWTTPIPPPAFYIPPSKSFPHFVISLSVPKSIIQMLKFPI